MHPKMRVVAATLAAVVPFAAACAGGPPPATSPTLGWSETGIASWYGPGFQGNQTANGETYDMEAMTAAHKELPFNTRVQVENLDNGRTVEVRINDRGPFVDGRIIDLSRGAARQIDMIGSDLGFDLGTCGKDGQGVPVADAQPTLRIPMITVGGQRS